MVNNQNGWLADVDANGNLDIVLYEISLNEKGKVVSEQTRVLLQKDNGIFEPNNTVQVKKEDFVAKY